MPLTPRFSLAQTTASLILTIHVPHVRVSSSALEIVVDGNEFHFHSHPYLLRLSLPGRLVDDPECGREARAVYDPDEENGTVTVTVHKAADGEGIWDDLDLVGRLAQPDGRREREGGGEGGSSGRRRDGPNIAVLSSTDNDDADGDGDDGDDDDGRGRGPSHSPADAATSPSSELLSLTRPRYGFLNLYHSAFESYGRDGLEYDMLELPDPDSTAEENRRWMRLEMEEDKFDGGRYLGDLCLGQNEEEGEWGGGGEDAIYDEAVRMVPHWVAGRGSEDSRASSSVEDVTEGIGRLSTDDGGDNVEQAVDSQRRQNQDDCLTPSESHLLATLPPSHAPPIFDVSAITPSQTRSLLLSLLDILFAYAYDHRTTWGEPTVESSWTVSILSPTLGWFERYRTAGAAEDDEEEEQQNDTPQDVLVWCMRRALVYPYLRSYSLARLIATDASAILSGGRRVVIRCLLQVRQIFDKSTDRYLLNKFYLDPYLWWVQRISEDVLADFAADVREGVFRCADEVLGKHRLGLDLVRLEEEAVAELEGGEDSDDDGDDYEGEEEESESDSDESGSECSTDSAGDRSTTTSSEIDENDDAARPSSANPADANDGDPAAVGEESKRLGHHSSSLTDSALGKAAVSSDLLRVGLGTDAHGAYGGDGTPRKRGTKPLIEEI